MFDKPLAVAAAPPNPAIEGAKYCIVKATVNTATTTARKAAMTLPHVCSAGNMPSGLLATDGGAIVLEANWYADGTLGTPINVDATI